MKVLYSRKKRERTVRWIEAETEDGLVVVLQLADTGERSELLDVAYRHYHVAASTAYLEVKVALRVRRVGRQLKLDASERELEGDSLLLHRTAALDWQRRCRHRHSKVHCRETVVPCHGGLKTS